MKGKLPVAIVIPHSGLAIPPELTGRIALSPAQIFNEADAYANGVYGFPERVLHWVSFPYARAVLDINRSLDPALNRPGDGFLKRQTSYGKPVFRPGQEPTAEEEQALIATYWATWHAQLAGIAADERVKLVIDGHTMAAVGPTLYGDAAALRHRGSVSNLGNRQATPHPQRKRLSAPPAVARALAAELADRLASLPTLTMTRPGVSINVPFYGGWNLQRHSHDRQPWCMIEINRALYIGHAPLALHAYKSIPG